MTGTFLRPQSPKAEAFRAYGTNPRIKEAEYSCVLGSPKGHLLLPTRVDRGLGPPRLLSWLLILKCSL